MDGWCGQVKKASSIVICSDAELREQAIARDKLFEAARAKLSPLAYKALTDDQSRWIKTYTARCRVSIDDPPPPMPIPQSVIECYRRESRARTAYLADRLAEPNPVAAAPSKAQPPTFNEAMAAWGDCTETAVDKLADQSEPAQIVALAAMETCWLEGIKYAVAAGHPADTESLKQATMPQLLARVMVIRAARSKLRKKSPETKPAIDYDRM
jgi:uncharacterized protein YecT (DUF1311 family)